MLWNAQGRNSVLFLHLMTQMARCQSTAFHRPDLSSVSSQSSGTGSVVCIRRGVEWLCTEICRGCSCISFSSDRPASSASQSHCQNNVKRRKFNVKNGRAGLIKVKSHVLRSFSHLHSHIVETKTKEDKSMEHAWMRMITTASLAARPENKPPHGGREAPKPSGLSVSPSAVPAKPTKSFINRQPVPSMIKMA